MAYVKKKVSKSVKDDAPVFDINEWIDTKKHGQMRVGSWSDSEIKYVIKKHPKKPGYYFVTIYMKKKMLLLMDNHHEKRIMVMQHKKDERRILLTRSANGYKVAQPSNKVETYFIKFILKLDGVPLADKQQKIVEPIFHEKGISSGSILEFKIEEWSK